jgi:hypothetical protein
MGPFGGGGRFVFTPFTLSKDEEAIVYEALDAFDRRIRDEKEADALHRLTRPMPKARQAK